MSGELLPLQLIFQGKTEKCLPAHTPQTRDAGFHLTQSENHWSSLQTMKDYVEAVIVPYVKQHGGADKRVLLVLDVWAVHKSGEFRRFLRQQHPNIHLLFVPARCTSKLQVADVVLQRPFKHGIAVRFNAWAAQKIKEQYATGSIVGLTPYLRMDSIKPLLLQWAYESWSALKQGKEYIITGWHTCVAALFDVHDPALRKQAVREHVEGKLEMQFVPTEEEEEKQDESEAEISSEDEEKDELDIMKKRIEGIRKGTRKRKQTNLYGYTVPSNQVDFAVTGSEDSDANGM